MCSLLFMASTQAPTTLWNEKKWAETWTFGLNISYRTYQLHLWCSYFFLLLLIHFVLLLLLLLISVLSSITIYFLFVLLCLLYFHLFLLGFFFFAFYFSFEFSVFIFVIIILFFAIPIFDSHFLFLLFQLPFLFACFCSFKGCDCGRNCGNRGSTFF